MERTQVVDMGGWESGGATGAMLVRHALAGDHRFDLERLVAFAAGLPPDSVVAREGRVPLTLGALVPADPQPGVEAAATIAEGHKRVQIYGMHHLAPYGEVLDGVLAQWAPIVAAGEGPSLYSCAITFLAAPRTVVPIHLDVHHTLVLQVSGSKRISVGRFEPPVEQRQGERFFDGGERCPTTLPKQHETFMLGPGDGVYIPPYAFHWVEGDDDVSVAFACGFATAVSERNHFVHRFNGKIRPLGLLARPPGLSLG